MVEHLTASPVMQAFRVRTPLKPACFFQGNILVSPFSMLLGDHGNSRRVELWLKQVYQHLFRAGLRAPHITLYVRYQSIFITVGIDFTELDTMH